MDSNDEHTQRHALLIKAADPEGKSWQLYQLRDGSLTKIGLPTGGLNAAGQLQRELERVRRRTPRKRGKGPSRKTGWGRLPYRDD